MVMLAVPRIERTQAGQRGPMQIPWQPISSVLLAVVITVTVLTSGVILFAALTGRSGDPGVERDE